MSLPEQRPLPAFTSVGCYPILYLTRTGDHLCAKCAEDSLTDLDAMTGDTATDADVYWEGPGLACDGCGETIESAYGDPEEGGEAT